MLVQKGYESDPVAAWSRAQEKVQISTHHEEYININIEAALVSYLK